MSSIVVSGDTSGSVTLSAPAVAGSTTLTLPSTSGTILTTASTAVVTQAMLGTNVVGNGPAFSAYQSSAQTLTSNTFTKITFTTEVFDTNNNFASSTFTPTVAGYYQINCGISVATTATVIILLISKNGSTVYKSINTNPSTVSTVSGSGLVYCNGSTDYIEVYGLYVIGQAMGTGSTETYFNGCLVRAA